METTLRDLSNFTEAIDNTDSVLLKDLLEFLILEKKFNLKEAVTSQEFQEYYKKVNQERQNKNGATYISHLPLIRWQIYETDF